VRRQPVSIVDGHFEGGYADVFELICPNCGDHPYLDYREVPPRLQWLRGPRTLEAALAIYEKHLGPLPGTNGDSAGSLWPRTGPPAPDVRDGGFEQEGDGGCGPACAGRASQG
jgi:hypothetical protein